MYERACRCPFCEKQTGIKHNFNIHSNEDGTFYVFTCEHCNQVLMLRIVDKDGKMFDPAEVHIPVVNVAQWVTQ